MKKILLVMMMVAVAGGVMAKDETLWVPENSTDQTRTLISSMKPGDLDLKLWSKLASYKMGDDPDLIYVLSSVLRSVKVADQGAIEDELIKIISSGKATLDGKQFACRILLQVGTEKSVAPLSKLLLDEKMSHFARRALERFSAADELRAALNKAPDSLKPGLIGGVGEIGDNNDVSALSKFAASENSAISGSAIKALAKIGTADALSALKKIKPAESLYSIHRDALMTAALKNRDVTVFKAIYSDTASPDRIAALRGWLRVDEASAVAEIIKIITGEDIALRTDALQIVTREQSVQLTEKLSSLVTGIEDKALQIELISALGSRGDTAALKTISGLAGSDDVEIANTAIAALGELNSVDGVTTLLEKMKSPKHAAAARKALAVVSAEGIADALASALADRDLTVQVLGVMAERMTFSAAAEVIKLLNDKSVDIRKAAWSAMPEVCTASDTEAIMSSLLKLSDKREISRAAKSVVALASNANDREGLFKAALKFNEGASAPVRDLILDLAAISGTADGLEMAKAAYASDDKELKAKALRVLCAWSTPNVLPTLKDLAEKGEDEITRVLALRGYIRLVSLDWNQLFPDERRSDVGMEKKTDLIVAASKLATRKEEKTAVIAALDGMGGFKSTKPLELVMTYVDDPDVRAEAVTTGVDLAKRLAKVMPKEILPMAEKLLAAAETNHLKHHAGKAVEYCKAAM